MTANRSGKRAGFAVKQVSERGAFWKGVAEGFGGPALMGACLNLPHREMSSSSTKELHSKTRNSGELARAILEATSQYVNKKELRSFVVKQKRLDRSGKMYDVDVVVVKPRQMHGKPHE